ncbi:uncharacterized protein YjiS (DUF1127 family) [Thioclava sp. ES.031]|uniref:DUF1127 domain-containing protein n=1 Tax=Thioclava sp. ES.031 TaxID=1798203 RepID=UPI000BF5D207|nr:DUF1127 domain-containing protein [Thioclava sp. ES.031]PFG64265.1 uncharacterized protein YjiS (DUF1127 family) [Thioclava sp. ES.031]
MTFLTRRNAACCAPARPARRGFFSTLARMADYYRSRRALERLDPRLLDDLGLSKTEAAFEARRRIWDAPDHWRAGR